MNKNSKAGAIVASSAKDEAQAIEQYSGELAQLQELLTPEEYAVAEATYKEVIADELNHLAKFGALFETLTDIQGKED